jgi:copper(I)-binding protein
VSPTRLLPAVALLVVVPLAGCAAGRDDATTNEHSTRIINANAGQAGAGQVDIRNVAISPSFSGNGTAQAFLTMTLVSQTTDTLTGVSLAQGGTVTPTDTTAQLTVRPQEPLVISDPETPTTNPGLAINGLPKVPVVGTTMAVKLTFQNAGSVTVQAPVQDANS